MRFVYCYKILVFSFNETRLDPSIHDSELIIPGYKLIRFDRNRHDIEAITIRLNLGNNVIVITSIYRPPSANVTYYQNMISYIDKVLSFGFDSVFLGDFNLDFIDQVIGFAKVNEMCNIFHLQQLIDKPTPSTISPRDSSLLTNRRGQKV